MVLSELKQGEKASVKDISTLNQIVKRLIQMGIHEGSVINIKTVMPFGGPFCYRIQRTSNRNPFECCRLYSGGA